MSGKKVYEFHKPWSTRVKNRLNYGTRVYGMLCVGCLCWLLPILPSGLRNNELLKRRHIWVRDEVKDVNNTDFAILDEEDPPTPLPPKTSAQQFREEFHLRYSKGY